MRIYIDGAGSNNSILLVNKRGSIRKLYTPFKVVCIFPVDGIKTGTQVYVDEVYGTIRGEIIYEIFKRPFHHSHFEIVLRF